MKTHSITVVCCGLLLFIVAGIGLTACNESPYPGFSIANNVNYRLYTLGETAEKPAVNDYITVNISYSTMRDSVFFSGRRKLQYTAGTFPGGIEACFGMLAQGDSACFILPARPFFEQTLKTSLPSFMDTVDSFQVRIGMLEIQRYADYQLQKREFLTWIKDFGEYEKLFLKRFIEEQKISEQPDSKGMYKLQLKAGSGNKPQKGDTVTVFYTGRFLNGVFFDSTASHRAFEFVYGSEWQVIQGMERAIGSMSEGEKSLFVLPSDLAFGQRGNSTGLIPPYTSVLYEVWLQHIGRADTVPASATLIE